MADDANAPGLEEPLFDPSLKKKKKKKTVAFNEELADAPSPAPEPEEPITVSTPTPAPASILKASSTDVDESLKDLSVEDKKEDDFAAMFGDMKKKKKKKEIPLDLDGDASGAAPAAAPAEGDELNDFSDIKKKKKKSTKKATFDLDAFEKELGESAAAGEDGEPALEGAEDEGDLGENPFSMGSAPVDVGDEDEPWHGTDRDYTYGELLHRIVKTLRAQNPDLAASGRKRYTIVPPTVHRDGNKKTVFANIAEICKRMHRQPEHVIQFLFAELGTSGSVDGSQRLVIKGRFQQKQLENVLRRYIVEYVTCKTCKSPETLLTKENRLYFMACESCGSKRSVSAIKTGFQAQVGKRRTQKAA